jgi:dGTPase
MSSLTDNESNKRKPIFYAFSKVYLDDFSHCSIVDDDLNPEAKGAIKSIFRMADNNWEDAIEYFLNKYKKITECLKFAEQKSNRIYIKQFVDYIEKGNFNDACKIGQECLDEFCLMYQSDKLQEYISYFNCDYNRIVQSSSFRRLQDKTQLFVREELEFSRRRLTRSLEVSNLAGIIASNLSIKFQRKNDDPVWLAMTSGVLHDIGNPPFGHYGETVIKDFFKDKKEELNLPNVYYDDIKNFDGNAQSLRIATKLMQSYDKNGASLSAGSLGSIIKYPFDSTKATTKGKIGYFITEREIIKDLEMLRVYKSDIRNPFASILEIADDLAYLVSDLEDAVHKGIVTFESFDNFKRTKNSVSKEFYKELEKKFKANQKKSKQLSRQEIFENTIRPVIYQLRNNIIKSIPDAIDENGENCFDQIVYNGTHYKYEVLQKTKYSTVIELIDDIKTKYVLNSEIVTINEINGDKVISFLMREFYEALLTATIDKNKKTIVNEKGVEKADYKNKILSLISKNFVNVLFNGLGDKPRDIKTKEYKTYLKMRLLIDFISGMTDTYARNLYLKINSL